MDSVPLLIDIDHFILLDIRPVQDVLLFIVTTNRLPNRQCSIHYFQPGSHSVVIEVEQKMQPSLCVMQFALTLKLCANPLGLACLVHTPHISSK